MVGGRWSFIVVVNSQMTDDVSDKMAENVSES